MSRLFSISLSLLAVLCLVRCANIVPPSGGEKDVTPPRLVAVSPPDSQRNQRITRIDLRFDEYITVNEASTQIQISPLLPIPLDVSALNKRVTIRIPDSLLRENTTYSISFGRAIQDLHEGNAFTGYTYLFSTGPVFDSLEIKGRVINAATGLPDTSARILLYEGSSGDSAVVSRRPMYTTNVEGSGNFVLRGLPGRPFRLYAVRDANANLTYDGGEEWIGFLEGRVQPGDTVVHELRIFPEPDSFAAASASTAPVANAGKGGRFGGRPTAGGNTTNPGNGPPYFLNIDTTNGGRNRSQDLTQPLSIYFSVKPASLDTARIFLSYDSAGVTVEATVQFIRDTAAPALLQLNTPWREDVLYTLRLQKGFAKDSGGTDILPGRYTFRTKRGEDYGKLHIHLPASYSGPGYLLQVVGDRDTVYQQAVTDSNVHLLRLAPGSYTLRVIKDDNRDGKWDPGKLFARKQPELVIPYEGTVTLKAGWENMIDFIPEKKIRKREGAAPR